jgi:hypothetical protein
MLKHHLSVWIAGTGLAVLIGCSASSSPHSMASSGNAVAVEGTIPTGATGQGISTDSSSQPTRQVILETKITVSVEELPTTHLKLKQLVESHKAIITHSTMNAFSGDSVQSEWTLRVAPAEYDSLLTAVGDLGDILLRQESSQDVTATVVDLEARIRNKAQEESRLLTHLETSTGNLEEILRVEKEISRVREELERMQGQRGVLRDRIDWATISVSLTQPRIRPSSYSIPFVQQISQVWNGSWSALLSVCRAGVIALIAVLPWAVVFGVPAGVVWRLRRSGKSSTAP